MLIRIGHLCLYMSTGKATWVGVLVINPDFHPQLFAFEDGIVEKVVPVSRKVFGDQSRARMDKHTADPTFLEFLHLKVDPLFGDLVVPVPEWRTPVFGRRINEILFQSCIGLDPFKDDRFWCTSYCKDK